MAPFLKSPIGAEKRLGAPRHNMRRARWDGAITARAGVSLLPAAHLTHRELRSPWTRLGARK